MTWGIAPLALAVGLLMGVLGGGGGIVLIPILVYLVGMTKDTATATSLIVVALGALAGLHSHARHGHTRWQQGIVFGLLGAAGSAVGSWGSKLVSEPLALTLFGLLLIVVIVLMIRKLRQAPPLLDAPAERRGWALVIASATLVGLLTGFFGVGGGFVIVPILMLVLGFPMKDAVGTSLLVIAVNGMVGVGMRAALGTLAVPWLTVAVFTALVMIGSWLGGRLGQRVPARPLNLAFIGLLICVSATMLALNVPLLLQG